MKRFKKRNILINKAKIEKQAKLYSIMFYGYKAFSKYQLMCPYKRGTKEAKLWLAGFRMAKQEKKFEPNISDDCRFDPELEAAFKIPSAPKQTSKKRRSTTKGKLEKVILRECLMWLKSNKIFAWRNNVGKFQFEGGRMIGFGIRGLADITGILPSGRFFAVEAKREFGGKQSAHQKLFQQRIEANNGIYILATSAKCLGVLLDD